VPIVLTEEESKPAEQFIFLCWTRHSHTLVQELMESTKQYVAEKQYTEALAALSEVIKIDPFFAEAYNRRATVHFGLKCADDCFADIERVRGHLLCRDLPLLPPPLSSLSPVLIHSPILFFSTTLPL
jgi:TPR repeat